MTTPTREDGSMIPCKYKQIECDKCGNISRVAAHIPIRFAWCPVCRSSKIRLYHKREVGK